MSPTDLLPIADLSASETKAITAKDLLEGVVINMDAGSIPVGKIDFSAGIPDGNILVTQGDVVLGRTTGAGKSEEIPCTAAGRALLAGVDAAAQRTSLGLGTLATHSGSWVDGSSFSGTSSGTNTGDQTITLTGPVTGSGKGTFATVIAAGAINAVQLANGAVTTDKLANDAVTAAKLASGSSAVVSAGAPSGAGAFTGQLHLNSITGDTYYYDGANWDQVAGFTSLSFDEAGPLGFALDLTPGRNSPKVKVTLDKQPPNTVWAGPSAAGTVGEPSFRVLGGADLPAPTGTSKGGVYQGEGTIIDADGRLHLEAATASALGGVRISGPSLTVDTSGIASHKASPLAAGSYVKVTTDADGHVVGSALLVVADIPDLDAAKITTGSLSPTLFGKRSITQEKLADYSIAFIQEATPGAQHLYHNGMLWFQESTGQLRMWNGNSWFAVGFGRLSAENLRYCGTFNAATGTVTGVTPFGTTEGFKIGDAIPAASDGKSGVYFVCATPGNATPVAAGVTFDAGDWVLCNGMTAGWVRIDTLSGGGGGGGSSASHLGDLLDVTLAAPTNGDFLQFTSSGQWVNSGAIDGGSF